MALERVASAIFSEDDISFIHSDISSASSHSGDEHADPHPALSLRIAPPAHSSSYGAYSSGSHASGNRVGSHGLRGSGDGTGVVEHTTLRQLEAEAAGFSSPVPLAYPVLVGSGSGSGSRHRSRSRSKTPLVKRTAMKRVASREIVNPEGTGIDSLGDADFDHPDDELEAAKLAAFDRWQTDSKGSAADALSVGAKYLGRGFSAGFVAKLSLSLLFGLIKRPGGRPTSGGRAVGFLARAMAGAPSVLRDTVRFATFVGGVLGTFRGVLALLRQRRRRLSEQRAAAVAMTPQRGRMPAGRVTTLDERDEVLRGDTFDKMFAGALAGLPLIIDVKERRQTIALYLFVRALDVLRNTLERRGILPIIPQINSILFGICNVPIMYGFLKDPSILPRSYYNWILWMGNLSDGDLEHMIRIYDRAAVAGKLTSAIPLNTCQGVLYQNSALVDIGWDWIQGLGRALRVYAPVHILPLLIFRPGQLRARPLDTVTHVGRSLLSSMAFLTTYQSIVKATQIVFHEGRIGAPGPSDWKSALSGLLTGFACFFEKPHRVNELMLYCAPRSIQSTFTLLERRGLVRHVAYGEVLVFMITTSIVFAQDPSDFKPVYARAVEFLLGDY